MIRRLKHHRAAAALALGMFLLYNANGREIGSYDSQPTKFAARELLLRGSLSLNHVVGGAPALIERHGFQLARDGRYRSAYSPVPAIAAAAIAWPMWKLGIIDLRAPLAANLISAVASALFVSLAVAIIFLTARLQLSRTRALVLAIALGAGTGFWSIASQTLWQHETAILGLSVAVLSLTLLDLKGDERRTTGYAVAVLLGAGLGLATGTRLQLLPAAIVVLAGVVAQAGWRKALVATSVVAAIVVPVCAMNTRWFGTPLGASPLLEAMHEGLHATSGSFSMSSGGFTGLLLSPNRGLFVYSPVTLVAALGLPRLFASGLRAPIVWCTLAALVQFSLYASYVVWWGGHTYGPRYMLDVLPLLVPLGIAGAATIRGPLRISLASVALAWSIAVAGVGAFNYPEGRWNNSPADVDRHHARLWDWRDSQIARTWQAGPSAQNFSLVSRAAFRKPAEP